MSTEKSCETCYWFRKTNVWPGDFCGSPAIVSCRSFSVYVPALTPTQQYAQELLEELIKEHKENLDYLEEYDNQRYLDHEYYKECCKTCQLIAKCEGRNE